MKVYRGFVLLAFWLFGVTGMVYGQTYVVNFTATPPTIDGKVDAGEWDAASPPMTGWTEHNSSAPEDANEPTKVRVLYSVDALYVLYECTDTDVISTVLGSERLHSSAEGTPGRLTAGEAGWTFANTDYLAIYLDPANVPDDAPNANYYSYSIQAEPSITANDERDDRGNSYNFTELGQYGRFRVRNPNPVDVNGTVEYWVGGLSWDLYDAQIVDGRSADGYVMEWRIPWSDLNYPYYEYVGSAIVDNIIDLDAADPAIRTLEDSVWGLVAVDGGAVSGMPLPGTVWKANFCRHSASATPQYTNWVGDTGGFVTRPFGDLVFGEAPITAVIEAFQHLNP